MKQFYCLRDMKWDEAKEYTIVYDKHIACVLIYDL